MKVGILMTGRRGRIRPRNNDAAHHIKVMRSCRPPHEMERAAQLKWFASEQKKAGDDALARGKDREALEKGLRLYIVRAQKVGRVPLPEVTREIIKILRARAAVLHAERRKTMLRTLHTIIAGEFAPERAQQAWMHAHELLNSLERQEADMVALIRNPVELRKEARKWIRA